MAHHLPKRSSNRQRTCRGLGAALLMLGSMSGAAYADESGVSYWLPGRFGSLAATPQVPGWSMAAVYYHTSVEASGAVAAARQIQIGRFPATVNVNLNASLNAQADLILLNPTYTFGTPVLGGQLAIGITGLFG
ncbi:phenol degradation protein meta, partial [Bradyrhizobium sp. CCBAU 45321]|nr:phenol degradation protein meta [Bradyrhizobium sp. CCBAU 45321]